MSPTLFDELSLLVSTARRGNLIAAGAGRTLPAGERPNGHADLAPTRPVGARRELGAGVRPAGQRDERSRRPAPGAPVELARRRGTAGADHLHVGDAREAARRRRGRPGPGPSPRSARSATAAPTRPSSPCSRNCGLPDGKERRRGAQPVAIRDLVGVAAHERVRPPPPRRTGAPPHRDPPPQPGRRRRTRRPPAPAARGSPVERDEAAHSARCPPAEWPQVATRWRSTPVDLGQGVDGVRDVLEGLAASRRGRTSPTRRYSML